MAPASPAPSAASAPPAMRLSQEDARLLTEIADSDRNGVLSPEELQGIVAQYNQKSITDPRILAIMSKYDENKDGKIDSMEEQTLHHEVSLQETTARYAGYSAVAARAFRYLAFTSDFGEALRPVASARLVTGSYAVALGYCVVDVGYEAYKHVQRGGVTESHQPRSLTQVVVERATFQAIASLAIPALLIHTTVDVVKKVTAKLNRFQRWGPSIAGLCFIPLLPLYLDHPVEHAIEKGFQSYGPWANKADKQH